MTMQNVHDDFCSCWKSGHISPDYSLCDCHVHRIRRLEEIVERGTAANRKQEAEIQRLSIVIYQLSSPPAGTS